MSLEHMRVHRRDLLSLLLGLGAAACSKPNEHQAEPEANSPEPQASGPSPQPRVAPDPRGSLDTIPASLRPAFSPEGHEPPPPNLAMDGEPVQSFSTYLSENPGRSLATNQSLAILPIGEYPHGFIVEYGAARLVRSPAPALLARFIHAWFGLPTRVLPAMPDAVLDALPAREHDGRRQLSADAVLDWLRTQRPDDAACVLALTLEDLYDETSEWLFGYASIGARVGVHSMLRYDPGFENTDARGPAFRNRIQSRALRVVSHEVSHMFGLRHCVHYRCIMNPTAGLQDLDALPLRACPVCLRKLWAATGVPLTQRWQALMDLSLELELDTEHEWYADRMRRLGAID